MNITYDYNGLWAALQSITLKRILHNANEEERKYEWLQAAELYKKASDLALEHNDFAETAELFLRMGFCFQKAALQAEKPEQFQNKMKDALQAYQESLGFFLKTSSNDGDAEIYHARAMIAYTSLWFADTLSKKKALSDEWWNLENEAMNAYEKTGNYRAAAKVCNDLMQGSHDQRLLDAVDWLEFSSLFEACLCLGEKAIGILLKINDDYELARAYCWTSWYIGFFVFLGGYGVMKEGFSKKSLVYSKKAMELSRKIGAAFLIGWSSNALSLATYVFEGNPTLALELNKETQKQSGITKDNLQKAIAKMWASCITLVLMAEEDPDKRKEIFVNAANYAQEGIDSFKMAGWHPMLYSGYAFRSRFLMELTEAETDLENKRAILKKIVLEGRELVERAQEWPTITDFSAIFSLGRALFYFSRLEGEISEKKRLLKEALEFQKNYNEKLQRITPLYYMARGRGQYEYASVQAEMSKIELNDAMKVSFLTDAVNSMEICIDFIEKDSKEYSPAWKSGLYGTYYYFFGEILNQLFLLAKNQKYLEKAVVAYGCAFEIFNDASLPARAAESCWQKAKIQNFLGEHLEAIDSYEIASQKYKQAAEKIPQLRDFYHNYALYMKAWAEIECARHNHSIEKYDEAADRYQMAAKLHESSRSWEYLAPNYYAWSQIEEAEDLSRKEKPQEAIKVFRQAEEYFLLTEKTIGAKINEILSIEEKALVSEILTASKLRQKYCQARTYMEDAKILYRKADYAPSSRNYRKAAEKLGEIIDELRSEEDRKELELVRILCVAWQTMAVAEEQTSSELYMEASSIFDKAKAYVSTKRTSLLLLGHSNFCRGLAAGIEYQNSLKIEDNSQAKSYLKSAATSYLQAGFKSASEYAKAAQRLFDAYLFMNQAENEVDPESRAKQYQMAENLLEMAAGSFMRAEQPEKTAQVQHILDTVREERRLALSLNQVLQAPAIASTTFSFATPTPTSEVSVGLEQFQHANLQANLLVGMTEVKVGESFCLTVEFVNAGREPALLIRVEDFVPPDFIVVKKPEIYRLEESCLNMKGKQIAPLKLVEAKLVLQPSKKGVYHLNPTVHYLDELGQNKFLQLKSVAIKVEEVVLADRVCTGTRELDSLLLGGIPKEYAVVLSGSPSDERELIIKNFLEAGAKQEQTSFYVTTEAEGLENLLEKSGFHLFLCNPNPKAEIPDQLNVYKLHGKTDLTNLNIALLKAYRNVEQSSNKRVCIEIVSDVLVDFGLKATRKWVAELTTDLVSKGFTVLAVMNPAMHPPDQATGITDLFDGEISLYQTEDPLECKKSLRIKKLRSQEYIKNPICLIK